MSKHTPTPWILEEGEDGQLTIWAGSAITERETGIYSSAGEMQIYDFPEPDEECQANAEFIVRACNAHEVLASSIYRVNIRVESGLKSGQINGAGEATLRAIASDIYFALVTLQGLAKARGEA